MAPIAISRSPEGAKTNGHVKSHLKSAPAPVSTPVVEEVEEVVQGSSYRPAGETRPSILSETFSVQDVLIPRSAGLGMVKKYYQRRTLYQYLTLIAGGLWVFHNCEDPAKRAGALGLLFPGAGLIAVATIPALLSFVVTIALIPLVMLIWFGMGGVFFPLALYLGSAGLAAFLAQDTVFEHAGALWATIVVTGLIYIMTNASKLNAAGYSKQQARNKYLIKAVEENRAKAVQAPPADERELDLHTLRFVQNMIERGLAPFDDFTPHDVIDQFQTAAIRYQIYGVIDSLALYQSHYAPGYAGALNEACRNSIEKSTTKSIMYYWKWEQIFGKFNASDFDPTVQDNIMLTGHLGVAMGLWESASGDRSFHEKDSLDFVIADGKHYKKNYQQLADAIYENMDTNVYCLYPCEPNWTYSLCNLIGLASLQVSDRILGMNYAEKIKPRFEKALEEEFTEREGRMLPIRSELTGLTIPGLCGTLNDCIVAMLLTACLPHIAHRNWAIVKKEFVTYDDKGLMYLKDLQGADKLDPGNYKAGEGVIRAYVAAAAAEFGDEKVRKEALEQLDSEYFPVEATPSGSLFNKGLSATTQVIALMARMLRNQDLANASLRGPTENALSGPILQRASFPEVLVAKAYSADGINLDLVLYNGKAAGEFDLQIAQLQPGAVYNVETEETVEELVASSTGTATARVTLNGRTPVTVRPA